MTEVYLTGLAGDICVYFSALDAVKEGFKTVLILDGCRPLDAYGFEEKLNELRSKGVEVVRSSELQDQEVGRV